MKTHALRRGHTALYIGGLSPVKNLRLLLDAGALVHRVDPLFKVVVAGDGPDRGLVEAAAASNPWLVVLRPVFDPRGKAALAGACDFMALPGLVGLAAVDSFALELPAVAVSPWQQAPEFEYLHDGVNCLISTPTPAEYARSIERMVSEPGLLERLRRGCRTSVEMHSLDSMVANFVAGSQAALAVT